MESFKFVVALVHSLIDIVGEIASSRFNYGTRFLPFQVLLAFLKFSGLFARYAVNFSKTFRECKISKITVLGKIMLLKYIICYSSTFIVVFINDTSDSDKKKYHTNSRHIRGGGALAIG